MTASCTESTVCTSCGEESSAAASFCIHCGVAQSEQAAAACLHAHCPSCHDGALLSEERVYCSQCRRLHPLAAEYTLDPSAFLWELDALAMAKLRSIEPLNAAAIRLTETIGRPWFEAAVNGIRLSEQQLPDVFAMAVRAARIVGLPYLPEVYVSGENMWDAVTMGSETSAFISLGSVLANMRGDDLLFVLAREMGHVRAGHTLWRTVVELAAGRQAQTSILGEGFLQFLNPAKLLQSAVQAPLMAWKRHSEITADRAGLLAVGKQDIARRALMQWALKSFPLYNRINQDAWLQQEAESADDTTIRVSEWTMANTPYLAGRLRLAREFMNSADFQSWRTVIEFHTRELADYAPPQPSAGDGTEPATVRLRCAACSQPLRVPRSLLEGGTAVNIRCPQSGCRKVMTVRPRQPAQPGLEALTQDGD